MGTAEEQKIIREYLGDCNVATALIDIFVQQVSGMNLENAARIVLDLRTK